MNRKNLGLTGAAVAMLTLILDSRAASEAAAEAVNACIRTVIPSLFPFFLISGYVTGFLGNGKFSQMIARMFHAPDNCGGIILTGLLGGYPVGGKMAAEQWRCGFISGNQADRLIMFCSQAGPSFLFGIVGAQLGGTGFGWKLWLVQLLSALSVAWLLTEPESCTHIPTKAERTVGKNAMRSALFAMASVCGWVIVFGVIIRFLNRWVLWLLPETLQILLCGLLELTNGCLLLSSVENPVLRFLLAAVMLNFGGVCVMMQTASVSEGLNMRGYFRGKIMQTIFSILFALGFLGIYLALVPPICLFSARFLGFFGKRGSILRKIGV